MITENSLCPLFESNVKLLEISAKISFELERISNKFLYGTNSGYTLIFVNPKFEKYWPHDHQTFHNSSVLVQLAFSTAS